MGPYPSDGYEDVPSTVFILVSTGWQRLAAGLRTASHAPRSAGLVNGAGSLDHEGAKVHEGTKHEGREARLFRALRASCLRVPSRFRDPNTRLVASGLTTDPSGIYFAPCQINLRWIQRLMLARLA